jgi:uncharacterized protein YlxW (UPF0749 family)
MRRVRSRLAVTLVAAILGFLAVVQVRSQATAPGLGERSSQELTVLIANLTTRNEQLRAEIATLQSQAADLAAGGVRGESSLDSVRTDLRRVRAWSGLAPVRGPGVVVTVSGAVPGDAIADVVNELRNAGAEALAVGGVRLVPGVVVSGPPDALTVGRTKLTIPVKIAAIGAAPVLTGSLTRVSGPIAVLSARFPSAVVDVQPVDDMTLPASDRTLVPVHGTPRL